MKRNTLSYWYRHTNAQLLQRHHFVYSYERPIISDGFIYSIMIFILSLVYQLSDEYRMVI